MPGHNPSEFPIDTDECCETLFAKADLDLFGHRVLATFSDLGKLPPPNGMRWGSRPGTRKHFDEWLILDPADGATFDRKIIAAQHSHLPDPTCSSKA